MAAVIRTFLLPCLTGQAIQRLLGEYAEDPMGGGEAIAEHVLCKVVSGLAERPFAFSVLAIERDSGKAVGLCNCFEGYSTFAAAALVNIHDCAVSKEYRGKRIAQMMLAEIEREAKRRGACKMTLEVLAGNAVAKVRGCCSSVNVCSAVRFQVSQICGM